MRTVKEFMTRDPIFCTPDTDLRTVARLMCEHSVGEIPVVDDNDTRRPIGVLTDRDITCRAVAQGKDPLKLLAKDCMTAHPVAAKPEMDLEQCVRLMERHKIRRVLVVDAGGALCGIVSQADIARKAPQRTVGEVLREVSKA